MSLSYTLIGDGASDAMLKGPIEWLLRRQGIVDYNGRFAYPAQAMGGRGLTARIKLALEDYPCELLLIHRDAEGEKREKRIEEIERAITESGSNVAYVSIVPVKMTESWFLFDQDAIRKAAGNPNGIAPLGLPKPKEWERMHAKQVLNDALTRATELQGRRLDMAMRSLAIMRLRVKDYIEDYSPLLQQESFQAFSASLTAILPNCAAAANQIHTEH